ncbi:MAG: hypothetical protein RLO81_12700, partial [Fulvivirga sp.]
MNKSIKIAILLVILAIPASIFTFLKYFGSNQFQVEVFYTDGVKSDSTCVNISGQYYVADSLLTTSDKH